MSIINDDTITLRIPDYWIENGFKAGNPVKQLGFREREIEGVITSTQKGRIRIRLSNPTPFVHIDIRARKTSKAIQDNTPLLSLKDNIDDLSKITTINTLEWNYYPDKYVIRNSDQIVNSWFGKFTFRQEVQERSIKGLRIPQVGAIHSIAAYMSVKKADPITIVLPTGTGKTDTMIASMVLCQINRILVVVPSDALRNQLFNHFLRFGCLQQIGAIADETTFPRIVMLKKTLKTHEQVDTFVSNINVIIATPHIIKAIDEELRSVLFRSMSHLFIDEAHHVAAKTWYDTKNAFQGKKIVQFTATPFRQDGKNLEGRIAYNFPLSEAQEQGYFKKIDLHQITEYSDQLSDYAIAEKSVDLLVRDLANYDHLIMVRTGSLKRAQEVQNIYQDLAPQFNPVLLNSNMRESAKQSALSKLKKRQSRIVICVDMLGEGFDLPNLKIAALHDVHKSLAVTLQYIGRFTRSASGVGDASMVFNNADVRVRSEIESLFSEDADWNVLLRIMSDSRIDKEIQLADTIDGFSRIESTLGKLPLWNLHPTFSIITFRTIQQSWNLDSLIDYLKKENYYIACNPNKKIIVGVIPQIQPVNWGKYQGIKNTIYDLIIIYWDNDHNLLYLHSTDSTIEPSSLLSKLFTGEITLINNEVVFRVFSNVERPIVRNLGLSTIGSISYTMLFGNNVTEGINDFEKSRADLKNIAGWGYEDGRKESWGCSKKKGKIWSVLSGSIDEFINWCNSISVKINDDTLETASIVKGFMRYEQIYEYHSSFPISIQWGDKIISQHEDRVLLVIDGLEVPMYEVDLNLLSYGRNDTIEFEIRHNDIFGAYKLHISRSGFKYNLVCGSNVVIRYGKHVNEPLHEYLEKDPVMISYIDGSVLANNYLAKTAPYDNLYDSHKIEVVDWTGIDLTKESQGKNRDSNSIQYRVIDLIKDDYSIIIDDDASGEAADVIALTLCDDNKRILMSFYHCKFSSTGKPGCRIDDMYQLCGQAQKSIKWKHDSFQNFYDHVKRRHLKWAESGFNRFIKGSLPLLYQFKKMTHTHDIAFEVIIVQPSLSKLKVSADILALLGSTEMFLLKTSNAGFRVMSSE